MDLPRRPRAAARGWPLLVAGWLCVPACEGTAEDPPRGKASDKALPSETGLPAAPPRTWEDAAAIAVAGGDAEVLVLDAATGSRRAAAPADAGTAAAPLGATAQVFLAADLLDRFLVRPADAVPCRGATEVSGALEPCTRAGGHGDVAVFGALAARCDHFFARVSARFGLAAWRAAWSDLGLDADHSGDRLPYEASAEDLARMGAGWHPGVRATLGAVVRAWRAVVVDGEVKGEAAPVVPVEGPAGEAGGQAVPAVAPRGLPASDGWRALLVAALRQRDLESGGGGPIAGDAEATGFAGVAPSAEPGGGVHSWALAWLPSRGVVVGAHVSRTGPGRDARAVLAGAVPGPGESATPARAAAR